MRPEIEGLELQKQQILQAIQANELEYRQVEQRREESRRLGLEINAFHTSLKVQDISALVILNN